MYFKCRWNDILRAKGNRLQGCKPFYLSCFLVDPSFCTCTDGVFCLGIILFNTKRCSKRTSFLILDLVQSVPWIYWSALRWYLHLWWYFTFVCGRLFGLIRANYDTFMEANLCSIKIFQGTYVGSSLWFILWLVIVPSKMEEWGTVRYASQAMPRYN